MPAPFTANAGIVVVPSNEHFELLRAEARESGKVHDMYRMVSAMQAAAAKCDLAHEEMVRLDANENLSEKLRSPLPGRGRRW